MVISNTGAVLGKSRKNHIPRVGDFNEVRGISYCTCVSMSDLGKETVVHLVVNQSLSGHLS